MRNKNDFITHVPPIRSLQFVKDVNNSNIFVVGAAILNGTDCDMHRLGNASHLKNFFRFSFGPLLPNSYYNDLKILGDAINSMKE